MKSIRYISAIILSVIFLQGCLSPPIAYDLPYPVDDLRNSPAVIWAYPRNPRVSLHRWASNDFDFTLDEFPDSDPQPEDQNVCWAYCASQVLKYDGKDVTVDELVEKIRERRKGDSLRGDAGSVLDIMRPLFGSGRFVGIYTPNALQMARSITYDSPIILALKPKNEGDFGHAVVLTGIRFSFYGQTALPSSLYIYDPLKGRVREYESESSVRQIWGRIAWCIYFTDFQRY